MATLLARALPIVSKSSLFLRWISTVKLALSLSPPNFIPLFSVCCPRRISLLSYPLPPRVSGSNVRGHWKRRWRQRPLARKKLAKVRQLEIDVKICIEEALPEDPEIAVHCLLHLLGFDHEINDEAEEEMEKEEELVLTSLGWKGNGLIKFAYDSITNGNHQAQVDEAGRNVEKEDALPHDGQKFTYIFCDMDGTLLNSQSKVTLRTSKALKEAISRGVHIVIATGKSRPVVIGALKVFNLAGKDGVVNESSPGVFLQRDLQKKLTSECL